MKYNILIAEDDANITELLTLYLDNDKFNVTCTSNGEDALKLAQEGDFSIALVDIMMPKMNGYEFIKEIRKTKKMPIIIISAKTLDEDKVLGLNLGADAYITKPFNPLVVVANIEAVLRRSSNTQDAVQEKAGSGITRLGELEFDGEKFLLTKNGKYLPLTLTELKIISVMMKSPERVFTKAQLYESINGNYYENDDNTMMVHISNIRSKIEDDPNNPKYLKTIRGLGYKIEYKG